VSVGNRGILRGLFVDTNKEEMQILVESIVHADTIPELKTDEQEIKSESATLIHWLTINPTRGNLAVLQNFTKITAMQIIRQGLYRITKEILYTWSSRISSIGGGWTGCLC
jgi:hypothetical protein